MRQLEQKFLDLPETLKMSMELYPEDENLSRGVLSISLVDTEKWIRYGTINHRNLLIRISAISDMVDKYKDPNTSDATWIFLSYIFQSVYSSINKIVGL